jgi:hypothetical protein
MSRFRHRRARRPPLGRPHKFAASATLARTRPLTAGRITRTTRTLQNSSNNNSNGEQLQLKRM